MIDEILDRIWKKNEPSTIIDTSFVENVIKLAMKEYAQEQTELLTIPNVGGSLPSDDEINNELKRIGIPLDHEHAMYFREGVKWRWRQ